jgi:hypothetical protein
VQEFSDQVHAIVDQLSQQAAVIEREKLKVDHVFAGPFNISTQL